MLNHMRPFMLGLAASVLWAASASATTYYVDFADGDNSADGQSPQSAWKHAPGDPNATDNPAAVDLQGGDTVIFRGGVAYHGSLRIEASGEPGNPITYDANTQGTFGQDRAILDGGRVVEGWQRAQSADEVGGNPRWQEIFYADFDLDISSNVDPDQFVTHRKAPRDTQAPWQRVILVDGDDGLLPIAQSPKPSDPFYPDLPRDFYRSEHRLEVDEDRGISILIDEQNLTAEDPDHYDGMTIGVHGGNNHVYFAPVRGYDPDEHRLIMPQFNPSRYDQTRYALYNVPGLIENPGEWAIRPLGDGRSRIYLLPDRVVDGEPDNIGYPVKETAVTIRNGASHIAVRGFLIQRYSGGQGGVSVARNDPRSQGITVAGCEIRFVAGHAGIGPHHADDVIIENNYIHHNPGWTTALFINRVNGYEVRNNYLYKNSGSGIRHYEAENGVLANNYVLEHFGMHASAVNVYEGCENVLLEGNYIQGTSPINRNAENITFRNNVIDAMGRSAVTVPIWQSGRTRGRDVENITFENNTFVRTGDAGWASAIFGQSGASTPRGLVVRHNVMDRPYGQLEGTFEQNIYLREPGSEFMGEGNLVIDDLEQLFIDPENGDFRRRPDGPMMDAGADVPPPPGPPVME